jgi:CheY-like chemotaxis protein
VDFLVGVGPLLNLPVFSVAWRSACARRRVTERRQVLPARKQGARGRLILTSEFEEMAKAPLAAKAKHARKLRVLVVDDNPDALSMYALLVRDMGHDVRSAANGFAAMEAARAFAPEVVLLDLVLPDIDGCDLAQDMKSIPGLQAARIFAVTAYNDDMARHRAFEAGCDGYFLKPMDPKVLERLLSSNA